MKRQKDYDAMGHRIAKHIYTYNSGYVLDRSTYYLLDAQGNTMSAYEYVVDSETESVSFAQIEKHIYGSSRLGVHGQTLPMLGSQNATYSIEYVSHRIGERLYELSNHLGNVLSIISDKVIPRENDSYVDHWQADIRHSQDYSPFGVTLHGRDLSLSTNGNKPYRYGFNSMEADDEIKGDGNSYDFGARMLDPRVGRFLSLDKKMTNFPFNSPYNYAQNNPTFYIDKNGDAAYAYYDEKRGAIVIKSTLIIYTGDKSVFRTLNPRDIKNDIDSRFNTMMIQNDAGEWIESSPSVKIGGKDIPVILDLEVRVVCSEKFNSDNFEEIEKGFETVNQISKNSDDPNRVETNATRNTVDINARNPDFYFMRVEKSENYSEASRFEISGNSGVGRLNQCYQNGKPTSTFAHELIFHGICGILTHQPRFAKGDFGAFDPLGTPSLGPTSSGKNTYSDGTEVDPSKRTMYKFEFDNINWSGFNLEKNTSSEKGFRIGGFSLVGQEGDQRIFNKNGKDQDGN